ncbi:MAG: Mur ligase domain-containing protein [Longibaculum sp.]
MKLNELLDEMNYQFIQGHLDEVSQIDYDSRTVQSGSLFVCIPGVVDGHSFIDQVIQKGKGCD